MCERVCVHVTEWVGVIVKHRGGPAYPTHTHMNIVFFASFPPSGLLHFYIKHFPFAFGGGEVK